MTYTNILDKINNEYLLTKRNISEIYLTYENFRELYLDILVKLPYEKIVSFDELTSITLYTPHNKTLVYNLGESL